MKADKHFDDTLRDALENLRAKLEPGSWEAFEQHLDHAPVDPTDLFDEVVSGKLANLPTPNLSGDWAFMEKLIEADEAAEILEKEAKLDNVVYEKIEHFEVPYQPQHWALMAKRLEAEVSIRYKIIRYKVAELALLALFLMTVAKYLPVIEEVIVKENPISSTGLAASQKTSGSATQATVPNNSIPANVQHHTGATATTPDFPVDEASLKSAKTAQPTKAQNIDNQPFVDLVKKTNPDIPIHTAPPASTLNGQPDGPLNKIASLGLSPLKSYGWTDVSLPQASVRMPNHLKTATSPELISALGMQAFQPKFDWELQPLPQLIFESQRELRFSLFANTSASYVFTPPNKLSVFDTIITTEPDTTFASGYGGGILVSWKKDKWEFQTGGMYSFKRYIPNTPAFLFETVNYYIREEFNGVQLDMMEVPLNASYYLKNEGNWRVYGLGGVSANFVVASVYVIESERTPSFNALSIPVPNSLPENNRSIRQETEFPNGLFDGGAVRDNFYMTANLGLGLERYVSPRWSLYLQPNYQHFFLSEGIGANKDRLNSFTFHLGTRVSLK